MSELDHHNSSPDPAAVVRYGLEMLVHQADAAFQHYAEELKVEIAAEIQKNIGDLKDFVNSQTLKLSTEQRRLRSEVSTIKHVLTGLQDNIQDLTQTTKQHERESRRQREMILGELKQLSENVMNLQGNIERLKGGGDD